MFPNPLRYSHLNFCYVTKYNAIQGWPRTFGYLYINTVLLSIK